MTKSWNLGVETVACFLCTAIYLKVSRVGQGDTHVSTLSTTPLSAFDSQAMLSLYDSPFNKAISTHHDPSNAPKATTLTSPPSPDQVSKQTLHSAKAIPSPLCNVCQVMFKLNSAVP